MRERVLLNVDLGEHADEPEALYEFAHVASVACGGHAGDDASMRHAVALCGAHGVRLGAHPAYPDREGFGRRAMAMDPRALRDVVAEQCARLSTIARLLGEPVVFVKPHGALYHAAGSDPVCAAAVVRGAVDALGARVTVIGPSTGGLAGAAAAARVAYAREAFADRATMPDGTLVARDRPGALIADPAAAAQRARELASTGEIETVGIHGDTPGAPAIARAVRAVLDSLAYA